MSALVFPAIKANCVGQGLSSAFLAHHKLRRFKRMMRPPVPRMTAGASHSDYHIDDNYTQLFLLRKTNNIPAKSFPVDVAESRA